MLERLFGLRAHGTSVRVEVLGGSAGSIQFYESLDFYETIN